MHAESVLDGQEPLPNQQTKINNGLFLGNHRLDIEILRLQRAAEVEMDARRRPSPLDLLLPDRRRKNGTPPHPPLPARQLRQQPADDLHDRILPLSAALRPGTARKRTRRQTGVRGDLC